MNILLRIRNLIMLPLLIITLITAPAAKSTDTAELVSTDVLVLDQAAVAGQGITTDGEYFYTSGSVTAINLASIAKFTVDGMDFVEQNFSALPEVCKARGNNHIGGISYYNGKIYAPVEGGDEVPACIVVYDAQTLEHTGEIYDLPADKFKTGVPWCAVDSETGYLYASEWRNAKTVYVYDVNDSMKPVKELKLTGLGVIHRIQGGEFLDGTLYLSNDTNDDSCIRNILSIDTETGEVKLVAQRDVGKENVEAEGMTFTKGEDGVVMHVLDYNRIAGVFVHHYNVAF